MAMKFQTKAPAQACCFTEVILWTELFRGLIHSPNLWGIFSASCTVVGSGKTKGNKMWSLLWNPLSRISERGIEQCSTQQCVLSQRYTVCGSTSWGAAWMPHIRRHWGTRGSTFLAFYCVWLCVLQCSPDTNYLEVVQASQLKCRVLHKTTLVSHSSQKSGGQGRCPPGHPHL